MSKTITGTITAGITLAVNPTIIDGTIQSYQDAIYSSAARTWTLTNNGGVYAGNVGILIGGGAHITNAANAYIIGYENAIDVLEAATINNAGFIYAWYEAIVIDGAGAVTNSAGGLISSGYAAGIVANENGHFTLLNQGMVSGYYDGVDIYGKITNAVSGTIAGFNGVVLRGGTLNNAGLIENMYSYYVGFSGRGIILGGIADSEIIEQKTGTIIGGIGGFLSGDTIDEAGITVTSVKFAHSTLTLFDGTVNVGTLNLYGDFNNHEFLLKSDGDGGTDIELRAETFAGTNTVGAVLSALSSTVAAHAVINGISAGVYRDFTLVNHGDIIATSEYADGVRFSTSGQITNTGLIEGAVGIYAAGGTITNFGTIDGTNGIAIDLLIGPPYTDITLEPGSVLQGAIDHFRVGETIDLAGVTAFAKTFANGVLTLSKAGEVVDTISLSGTFKTASFKLASDKHGGTDITLGPADNATAQDNGVSPDAGNVINASIGAVLESRAAASMQFLRPAVEAPSLHLKSLPHPKPPSPSQPTATATPPTLTAWLPLDSPTRPTIPPITLHAG